MPRVAEGQRLRNEWLFNDAWGRRRGVHTRMLASLIEEAVTSDLRLDEPARE